jgi:hypothetical protein
VDEHMSVAIENSDVHGLRVQIDAAAVAMLTRVESRWFSPCAYARLLDEHPAYSEWSRSGERPRMRIKRMQSGRPRPLARHWLAAIPALNDTLAASQWAAGRCMVAARGRQLMREPLGGAQGRYAKG